MTVVHLRGVPIHIHWTLGVLMAGWVGFAAWSGWPVVPNVALILLYFASVLAHEVGHVVVATRFGVRTRRILLLPIGGAAQMERRPLTPYEDLMISVAGPAVNLGLALLLVGPTLLGSQLALWVLAWNLGLGLFNLIPAFPMDGGRVLRAVLTEVMGAPRARSLTLLIGFSFALSFFLLGTLVPQAGLVVLAVAMGVLQWQEYRIQRRLAAVQGA